MGSLESFMSDGSHNERMETALSNFIQQNINEEVMLNKFIVIMELVEPNDRTLAFYSTPGMRVWESHGLLNTALSFEENNLAETLFEDEDDGDELI